MFKAPIETIRLDYLNFMPNHLGAENVVVFELTVAANLTVYNLCKRYNIMHVDCNRGLIQGGKMFTSANERINVGGYPPATYQRSASAYPTTCRNTMAFEGLLPKNQFELIGGREYFHRFINGTYAW